MKEIRDIIAAYDLAVNQAKQTALATVVQVDGSSYRRPGARMLVTEDGQLTGAISGGCLEGDAMRKALLAMHSNQKKLVEYDTMDEDDIEFGVQLGCNGRVYILFEPVDANDPFNPIVLLKKVISDRVESVLVTGFSISGETQTGTCLLSVNNETIGNQHLLSNTAMQELIDRSFTQKTNLIEELSGETFLVNYLVPSIQLVIAGAGNDVQPLVQMADLLGWDTIVADGRKTHATVSRFPSATRVLVIKPEAVLEQITNDKQTAFLLMTHNYNYDLALLRELLNTSFKHVGILGPKKKFLRMQEDLDAAGVHISDAQMDSIFSPTGLDIGAETAEEIALSIIAEIKAHFSGSSGISLRNKSAPIHQPQKI